MPPVSPGCDSSPKATSGALLARRGFRASYHFLKAAAFKT
jgi:hypothetical protein